MRILLVISFLQLFNATAQHSDEFSRQIDSLQKVAQTTTDDSVRVLTILAWDDLIYVNPEQDFLLNQQMLKICENKLKGELPPAKNRFFKKHQAIALNNLGLVFWKQGDYIKATECHTKALKVREEIGDKQGVSGSLGNIALIYWNQLDYNKAEEYILRSLAIDKELGDSMSIGVAFDNMGLIKKDQGHDSIALTYHKAALNIRLSIGDVKGVAYSYINIGLIHQRNMQMDSALVLYNKSLTILKEIGDEHGAVGALFGIGSVHRIQKQWTKALPCFMQAYNLAEKNKLREDLKKNADAMSFCYRQLGDYKNALMMQDIFVAHKDTLERAENASAVYQQEFKYKYEKQAHADSIKQAESDKLKDARNAHLEAVNQKQEILQVVMAGGIALILIFFSTLYLRFRKIRTQKSIIENQKSSLERSNLLLEVKTQEVIDSIAYAQRIQEAYLPPQGQLAELFPNSFLYYRPKDILSGDFYWFHQVEQPNGEQLNYVAVADCTGHGVPGAIMSVICAAALTEAARTLGKVSPAEILTTARTILLQNLKNTENHTARDGMDISLVRISETTRELVFSGAHNPLWIFDASGTLTELKGDKQPVGSFEHMQPFTDQSIILPANCTLYLSSDGFQDQFGGAHLPNGKTAGKKFKAANLKKLLAELSQVPIQQHVAKLDQTFDQWRGDLEQVDDVCVIGVRV